MNKKEWAKKLNNRRYTEEITKDEEAQAKADGIVVVFGASDDLIEFRGAFHDEAGAWEGTTVQITSKFTIFNKDNNAETFEFNIEQIAKMRKITAVWCPENKHGDVWASWNYKTDIPHEKFAIFEDDGDVYCHGIVFESKELSV